MKTSRAATRGPVGQQFQCHGKQPGLQVGPSGLQGWVCLDGGTGWLVTVFSADDTF